MSVNSADDNYPSPRPLDETESPRKRLKLDSGVRKSWSLMDRRTDEEVLQEMGVSLLEPDDCELVCDPSTSGLHHKPHLKRKRDIENVNPNTSLVTSPRSLKTRSPKSAEKSKPLQTIDQLLETTLTDDYLIDEETPLAQSVSGQYVPQGSGFDAECVTTGGKRQGGFTPQPQPPPLPQPSGRVPLRALPGGAGAGEDSSSALSDEMMLSVFRWLPKRALAHCMLVCKRWYRVACDETLWQRLDLGNKTLNKNALGRILSRKPVIVRLASSEIGAWHPAGAAGASRLQYLDLSMCSCDAATLDQLLLRCPALKKLSLESVTLADTTCHIIGRCSNIETLNLTMARGIMAEGLTSILNGCTSLIALNISWCNLNEAALHVLVTRLPTRLQRLNVGGARIMTDEMLEALTKRVPRLLELDVSDCSRLGAGAVSAVTNLRRLEHLAVSRCYLLPAKDLYKLNSMPSLQYVEVWGMLPAASLAALAASIPAAQLNQFMFSAIARPTVGTRRTSIWGLRTRD